MGKEKVKAEVVADVAVAAPVAVEGAKASYILVGPDTDGKYVAKVTFNGITADCKVNTNYKNQAGVFIIWFEGTAVYGGEFTKRSLCTKNLEGDFSVVGRNTSGNAVSGGPKVAVTRVTKVNYDAFYTEDQKAEVKKAIDNIAVLNAEIAKQNTIINDINNIVKPKAEEAAAKAKADTEAKKFDSLIASLANMPEDMRNKILATLKG